MKLHEFFATIAPVLDGTQTAAEAAPALYGSQADGRDARRLAVYAHHCREKRYSIVELTYPETVAAVVRQTRRAAWESLVDGYFRDHPMRQISLTVNARQFPAYLTRVLAGIGLPLWIAELADLEWGEWETAIAPTVGADDATGGELRLASTVSARTYGYELVQWLEAESEKPSAPRARRSAVLLWRDSGWCVQRAAVGLVELGLLQAIRNRVSIGPSLAGELQTTPAEMNEALDALTAMGIVLGRSHVALDC